MNGAPHPEGPPFRLAPELEGRLLLGLLSAAPVAVDSRGTGLEQAIEDYGALLRARHQDRAPGEIEALKPARELYRIFGLDPTKTRPSSEALLRRVLRDKPLPRISNAVDLVNLLALRFLLPIGLYDAATIAGPVLLRAGLEGESYVGVRKDRVGLSGRPVLVDDEGPFGNPTADSLRTAVADETRALWMVVFAPASFPRPEMVANLELAAVAYREHLRVVPGTEVAVSCRVECGPA